MAQTGYLGPYIQSVSFGCQLVSLILLQVMSPESMVAPSLTCQTPGLRRLEHVELAGLPAQHGGLRVLRLLIGHI